ncbi:ABC transporter permease [Leucobacter sp. UT-8R-CII-1-4]|uniref:putative B6 ABC transporter permease subunit 2 n=1 Tax=Leucobacter sp. UT-8R-CII-1-4 TaxID=3040075 RepID=UPI0024A90E01|nr:ABC transporter permease [Leucobacter sp. UT-8R-CII-1-4]MDI6023878.1 ABC transporter permease [Leucobacter sp. UT-8R-CII-1-4]
MRKSVGRVSDVLVRTVAPIVLALVAGGLLIALLGADPFMFYANVWQLGTQGAGLQQSLTAMAPLLLVALGLIIAFRAQLWNLGYGGSYLLSAAVVAGLAPDLFARLPYVIALLALVLLAILTGALLGIVPALLKAYKGTNEVITSLMMSFIAISVANLLIRGVFKDPSVSVPQTKVLDLGNMLPFISGTQIHIGVLVSLVIMCISHYVLTKTSLGLKIDMLGASPRAAAHAGVNVRRLIVLVFVCSSAMIALAALVDMLGLWGYSRAEWNPGYGDKILPFVFLARLSPLAAIPLVGLYSVLATGGVIAAQRAGISVDVLSVLVALVLFFMVAIEFLASRATPKTKQLMGRSYLRRGLFGRTQADRADVRRADAKGAQHE